MKKIYIFIIIGLILIGCALGFYFYKRNNSNISNNSSLNDFPYNSTRVSTSNNSSDENTTNTQSNNETSTNNSTENLNSSENSSSENTPVETEIASFNTKIYTKESDRQNNISITCSTLNDTTVENGETFSFCNTVGKATSSKGYKKADVFQDGEKIEALGRTEIAK